MNRKILERDYACNFIADLITIHVTKNEYYPKVINIVNKLEKNVNKYYSIDISYEYTLYILEYTISYLKENKNIELYKMKDYIYKMLLTIYSLEDIEFKNEIYPILNNIFKTVEHKISESTKKFDLIDDEYIYIIQMDFINNINKIYNEMSVKNFIQTNNYCDLIKSNIIHYKRELESVNKPSESIIIDSNNLNNLEVDLNEKPKDYRPIEIFKNWNVIHSKRLGIFMAPTGYGKSHLLCHIAADYLTHAPEDPDYDKNLIFYFSFENTKEETLIRILSNISDIPMNTLMEPENRKIAIEKLREFTDRNSLIICELPPKIYGGISSDIIEKYIEDYMSNSNKKCKIYGIIIDYLDLMSTSGGNSKKGALKWEALGEVTIELKSLAMKLNTPVITATQTNREGEIMARDKQIINRTNVAESYEKIKNADILIGFLTSPAKIEMYNETFTKAGKFFIMKHRYSQDGIIIPFYADFRRSKFFTKEVLENNNGKNSYHTVDKCDNTKNQAPDEEIFGELDETINDLLTIKE